MFQSLRRTTETFAIILLMSASLWLALFAVAKAEVVRSFESDIVVNSDSSFTVTETIVYDFGQVSRHGIYRNIKDKHPQGASVWYKTRHVEFDILSVSRDGRSEPYTLEKYDGLSVKIGDPNETIIGQHTYQIEYLVKGGLAEYADGTEVYWNVTGDEWQVSMEKVSASVSTAWSDGLISMASCYVGVEGSNRTCQIIDEGNDKKSFEWGRLNPGEQLTVAQRLDYSGQIVILEKMDLSGPFTVLSIILFATLLVWLYRWRTRYRTNEPIIAQYEPLTDFKPMFTGVLFDGKLDSRDITAGIIYLAQQGHLKIRQTAQKVLFFDIKDHEVTLQKPVATSAASFDDEIASLLFKSPWIGNETVKLSQLRNDRSKMVANQAILRSLYKAVEKEMVQSGFLEERMTRAVRGGLIFVVIFFGIFFLGPLAVVPSVSVFYLTGVIGLILFLSFGLERKTIKGYEAVNYLKGFKDFLKTTDKERYRFHNAPALNPEQFMEYLPYAIAFGVEKEWAEVFKDIQITSPDWYQSDAGGGSHFNAVAFTAGLNSFSTSFSSSSGSSGSSGGGSSGGGGGGGGGGSW